MKARRLIFVGLLVSLLLAPWTSTWASTDSQDGPVWTGWIDAVVQWVASIVTIGTDGTETVALDPADTTQLQVQDPGADTDRGASLDPDARTAK